MLERFRVDQKIFLGLAMPNQTVEKDKSGWFLGDTLGLKTPNLQDPKYTVTTVLYDT